MNDDQRFDDWWQSFASPRVEAHLLGRMHEAEIKAGAKQSWDAALTWKKLRDEAQPE